MEQKIERETMNPLIKRILKSFQATANDSLNGPNAGLASYSCSASPATAQRSQGVLLSNNHRHESDIKRNWKILESKESKGLPPSRAEDLRQALGQMPVMIPIDRSVGVLTESVLEGHTIACFDIGGEKRLCLPQVLNSILSLFTLPQINAAYEELRIFCSLCSTGQLYTLKCHHILPASAASCGLITKTNAERLCSWLLRHTEAVPCLEKPSFEDGLQVSHKCFGKGRGIFILEQYTTATSLAIRCCDCNGMFSPPEFVCHSHFALENRVCHWGFESSNWRNYLALAKDQEVTETMRQEFEYIKALFQETKYSSSMNNRELSGKKRPWLKVHEDPDERRDKDREEATDVLLNSLKFNVDSVEALPLQFRGCPVLQKPEKAILLNHPETKNPVAFAPNVSLVPDDDDKKMQQLIPGDDDDDDDDDEGWRTVKCRKVDITSDRSSTLLATQDPLPLYFTNDPGSWDHDHDHVPRKERCTSEEISCAASSSVKKELHEVFEREMSLFRFVLDGEDALSAEKRKQVYDEYVLLHKRHLALVDRLVCTHRELKKELFDVQRRVTNTLNELSVMHITHKDALSRLRFESDASVMKSNEENKRLQSEMELLTFSRKRSDLGLMKAKYKAQAEHFRRKCQLLEQSNSELLPKCVELKRLLRRCYRSAPSFLPPLQKPSPNHLVT